MGEVIEYIEANYRKLEGQTREFVIDAFEAGQQSQQAKIDELQARLDEALKSIMICEEYDHAEKLDEIYNILKGNKDE